jgi:hypothetical protein
LGFLPRRLTASGRPTFDWTTPPRLGGRPRSCMPWTTPPRSSGCSALNHRDGTGTLPAPRCFSCIPAPTGATRRSLPAARSLLRRAAACPTAARPGQHCRPAGRLRGGERSVRVALGPEAAVGRGVPGQHAGGNHLPAALLGQPRPMSRSCSVSPNYAGPAIAPQPDTLCFRCFRAR